MSFAQYAKPALALVALSLVLFTGRADAQGTLSPAIWQESISLEVQTLEVNSTSFMGSDFNMPEPHTETLSGTGYEVSGVVAFGTAAPPVGIAQVNWDISQAGTNLTLSTNTSINFGAKVVQTAEPPVSVTDVPVHLVASGSVDVEPIFGAQATSFFRYQPVGTSVLIQENLDVDGEDIDPVTEFSIDDTHSIPPDVIILVAMTATARMGVVGTPATTGSATGMVDPIIEVADELIPGTDSNYRDFFTIEFSPGYDAQTPVEPMTLGKLKRRFIDPR